MFPLISSTGAFQNGTAYTQDAYTATQASYVPSPPIPPTPPPTPTPAASTGNSPSDVSLRPLFYSLHVHISQAPAWLQEGPRHVEHMLCVVHGFKVF